jgi:hypothetical protein
MWRCTGCLDAVIQWHATDNWIFFEFDQGAEPWDLPFDIYDRSRSSANKCNSLGIPWVPTHILLLVAHAPSHPDAFQYQGVLRSTIWSLIQDWVRTTDDNEFNACWTQIQGDTEVPKSIAKYIVWDWLPQKDMWSAMSHQNHTIFEEGDTNMLLELYVIALINIYIFSNVLFLTCY